MSELSQRRCEPCEGGVEPLGAAAVAELMASVHSDWKLKTNPDRIIRLVSFVGFNRPMAFANAVAYIAGDQGHHPQIRIAYGECEVEYYTHAIKGLSENDFICAAKIDELLTD
ncbi:MAG: 4a-hydroxytetrahydrobiopterin dehydratase [Pseudomonadota bacterium]